MESLFVPALAPAQKHPTVFRTFDALENGASFILVNDHDPIPLFYELKAERGDVFNWKKIENGPEVWKVEITKTAAASQEPTRTEETTKEQKEDNIPELNVTLLEPRQKHPTIFRLFDGLKEGESLRILNDHDPKPLYYQMIAERGNIFTWQYLEQGPRWWKVLIRKNDEQETVGQIAAKDVRKAEVFKKLGIDFCCGGKKTLEQVCTESGLELSAVENALNEATTQASAPTEQFDSWDPGFLADYIYNRHHKYYYSEGPVINDLLHKVIDRHGAHYPELAKVASLYKTLQAELQEHFLKEEKVLFPFIKALDESKRSGHAIQQIFPLQQPVQLMESDHEAAGGILAELSKVTNQYTPPANACNSFQFLYQKLKALEDDLHQHIHLENNILFPKALKMEKEIRS